MAGRIGDYFIEKTLGTGSFAVVKLATHLPTNKKVAVKIYNIAKLEEEGSKEKIKREISILRTCRHPHIIKQYEVV